MTDLLRQEIAATAQMVVVKVGTRVLTRDDGSLNRDRIASLAQQLAAIRDSGRRVVLVSSGAVGAGMNRLEIKRRPNDLAMLQAVAAVGQTRLIEAYDATFRHHHCHAAQVLLTAEDFDDRTRYLNVRNTLLSLLRLNAIPVINENDTVAVDELMTTFGDNDRLAALVTNLLRAPLLIVLSDVDGLYDGDPAAPRTRVVETITRIDDALDSYIHTSPDSLSKGGMASKIDAAQMVTSAGENMVIASGREEDVLARILAGENVGTLFLAQGKSISPWKRWIGFSVQPRGKLSLDAGACRAIEEHGRSLLSIGVTSVDGDFVKGDAVIMCSPDGVELARGLTNYSSDEIRRIAGRSSEEFADLLGHRPYDEVVHRDNLAILRADRGD